MIADIGKSTFSVNTEVTVGIGASRLKGDLLETEERKSTGMELFEEDGHMASALQQGKAVHLRLSLLRAWAFFLEACGARYFFLERAHLGGRRGGLARGQSPG